MSNSSVYASYTKIGNRWMRGLFACIDLAEGQILCEYIGSNISKKEADTSSSMYLMAARCPSDMRRRIILDGNPDAVANLAGFANFVIQKYANCNFVDMTRKGDSAPKVVLVANQKIRKGTEIRVDYDMGSSGYPFLHMMLESGIDGAHFRDKRYQSVIWQDPRS